MTRICPTCKKEFQITKRQKDKLAWQQNRRRIAYISMFTMVATVIASFVFPDRAKEIPAMDVLFISLAAIIGAFFGADAMVSKKK